MESEIKQDFMEDLRLEKIRDILTWYALRPPSKRELDQFPADLPSIVAQASFMKDHYLTEPLLLRVTTMSYRFS